jgi:hypothetical protein
VAFLQRAWIFEPVAFHLDVARSLGDRAFDVEAMKNEVARRMSLPHTTDEYLRMLGLAGDSSLEGSSLGELYVACMAPHLRQVDSLSEPAWMHHFLSRHLDARGLADRLVFGASLDTMVATVPEDRLARAVRGDLVSGAFGGWLSRSAALEIAHAVEQVRAAFITSSEAFVGEYRSATGFDEVQARARVRSWPDEALHLLTALPDGDSYALRLVAP